MPDFETVIGLEVHVELSTRSKMFCGCPTAFGAPPNTQVCPVCLGMPGVLPVVNAGAVSRVLATAVGCGSRIAPTCRFARKNYFYPDMPKNYQISQFEEPFARGGELEAAGRTIRLTRIHLEEDAGKLVHAGDGVGDSAVDCNRAGIPLMEIVTEPDIRSPEEAEAFLEELKLLLEYLDVSDCTMEEGSLRCDANISLRPAGRTELGVKTEVKNLNSFRAVRRALAFEAGRQAAVLARGETVAQETRLWNEALQATESMRGKEEAHDYRYFPEPDLVPVSVSPGTVEEIRRGIGELPAARRARFSSVMGLSDYDARVLTARRETADYFEAAAAACGLPKQAANWVMGDLAALVNETGASLRTCPFTPERLAELVRMVADGDLTATAAKDVLRAGFSSGTPPRRIAEELGVAAMKDTDAVARMAAEAVRENPKAVEDFRAGRTQAIGFLVGQVMRMSRGTAPADAVRRALLDALEKSA